VQVTICAFTDENNVMICLSRIHPFPARMAPSIVEEILRKKRRPLVVLDPMSGSGTTLATAALLGHTAIGFDTDPLAVLLSGTLTLSTDPAEVVRVAQRVLARSREAYAAVKASDAYPLGTEACERKFLRYWFSTTSRKQLYCLSLRISTLRNPQIRRVLWVALSRMIIKKDNGVSLAMDISHSRPHRVYDIAPNRPFDCFMSCVRTVLGGIKRVNLSSTAKIRANVGDARNLPLNKDSVDLVITSPPYFNAIDYMRAHKMSLIWMGHRLADLRTIRSTNIGAEVGLSPTDHDTPVDIALRRMGSLTRLAQRQTRMLRKFVWDMNLVVREVHRVLAPGGEAFFVIGDSNLKGTFVRNSAALESIARSAGLDVFTTKRRRIPDSRRYLPPPSATGQDSLGLRMRREVVIGLRKASS
jgi:SAM-dependent methyltransferase